MLVLCCCTCADGMSGVGQLLLENEKTKRKLRKVQQRRDHYAKLYFQTLAQLEQVRAELAQATNAVKELRGRGGKVTAPTSPRGGMAIFMGGGQTLNF